MCSTAIFMVPSTAERFLALNLGGLPRCHLSTLGDVWHKQTERLSGSRFCCHAVGTILVLKSCLAQTNISKDILGQALGVDGVPSSTQASVGGDGRGTATAIGMQHQSPVPFDLFFVG